MYIVRQTTDEEGYAILGKTDNLNIAWCLVNALQETGVDAGYIEIENEDVLKGYLKGLNDMDSSDCEYKVEEIEDLYDLYVDKDNLFTFGLYWGYVFDTSGGYLHSLNRYAFNAKHIQVLLNSAVKAYMEDKAVSTQDANYNYAIFKGSSIGTALDTLEDNIINHFIWYPDSSVHIHMMNPPLLKGVHISGWKYDSRDGKIVQCEHNYSEVTIWKDHTIIFVANCPTEEVAKHYIALSLQTIGEDFGCEWVKEAVINLYYREGGINYASVCSLHPY